MRKSLLHRIQQYFLEYDPRAQATKAKIDKLDYIRLENIRLAKEIVQRVKRNPVEWDKIFANNVSENELISRIHKGQIQLNNKRKTKTAN